MARRMRRYEYEILVASAREGKPSLALRYFFSGPGRDGFELDKNFDPPWQEGFVLDSHGNKLIIGGFGSGKSKAAVFGLAWWALVVNDFKAVYAAKENKQAMEMFKELQTYARGSPLETGGYVDFKKSPTLTVIFEYIRPDGVIHHSEIVLINAGDGATGSLSYDVDWVHLDEAFSLSAKALEDAIMNLGTRARGTRSTGERRLGVFSMSTNPFDNPTGWNLYDTALANPDDWYVLVVPTFWNGNVSDEQLANFASRIPEGKREQFLMGKRPDTSGGFFSLDAIDAAAVDFDDIERINKTPLAGVYNYECKYNKGSIYEMAIDLGTGHAPFRNAPVIAVVESRPELPSRVAYFWWGDGKNTNAVIEVLKYATRKYNPANLYVDSTGAQRGIHSIIADSFAKDGLTNVSVIGVDFTRIKSLMLYTMRLVMERVRLLYYKDAIGIKQQLTQYPGPHNDKNVAQDIVMTLAMLAQFVWATNQEAFEDNTQDNESVDVDVPVHLRRYYRARRGKSGRRIREETMRNK